MSERSWLLFLLKIIDTVLDALRDYLKNSPPPEEKKPSSVGE